MAAPTGLKPAADAALNSTGSTTSKPEPKPVEVSAEAHRALATMMREWSGWTRANLVFGKPDEASPFASCDHVTRTFTANVDVLVRNPHRVLLTVTPFRLRQEAVLTGALLHEAGHARHSLWQPRTPEALAAFRHGDGSAVAQPSAKLARLMEEPRIEGLQAREADKIGATGLAWTMRASAAQLIPTTVLNTTTPEQQIMDLITSWALRAGRQIALHHHTGHAMRNWVADFTNLLHRQLVEHFTALDAADPHAEALGIVKILSDMIKCEDDRGTTMIDLARMALTRLFPETPADEMPEPDGGCGDASADDEGEQPEEAAAKPQPSEDQTDEPEEGSEDAAGEDESDEQESGEGEDQSEGDEPGDSEQSGEGDSDEGDSDEGDSDEGEQADEGDSDEGDGATSSTGADSEEPAEPSALAKALAALEAQSQSEAEQETIEEETPPTETTVGGSGNEAGGPGGFRLPSKDERELAKGAERFLRDLISPTEASTTMLTETPSATVDGAALAAWKASGETRDPMFFRRTKRSIQPSPPVMVAVLVDVSYSMSELQKPSSVLSWALASAAMDLRNFAGRGQQVESTMIHWGNRARVVQRNGEMLPGIREVPCKEGTSAMAEALSMVEEQMPGFFEVTDKPVHRLLVQFTDWELGNRGLAESAAGIKQSMAAGVNMVTVVPRNYNEGKSALPMILKQCDDRRGTSTVLRYNRSAPERVWEEAAKALS